MNDKNGMYPSRLDLNMTEEMYQFVKLMAERQGTNMNNVVRQAIRDHLDLQEDIITSRSRLARTVKTQLEEMHSQMLAEIQGISKLLLAAAIASLIHQGLKPADAVERITNLATQPGMDTMLKAMKKKG